MASFDQVRWGKVISHSLCQNVLWLSMRCGRAGCDMVKCGWAWTGMVGYSLVGQGVISHSRGFITLIMFI